MKLLQFIPEIKIQPNSQPKDLKQLSWFVEINRNKICDKTYEIFKEYDEEGYKIIFDSIKENGIIKIDNKENCVTIRNWDKKIILLIFLPGKDANEHFNDEGEYTRCDINVNGVKLVTGIY